MSGGVESTLLLLLLIQLYGADSVIVFSGEYQGRRGWEATNAKTTALRLGVNQHYSIPQTNAFMSPEDNLQMFRDAKRQYKFDGWFNGTNAKLFSKPSVTTQDVVDRLRERGYYIPFVFLEKQHTVDMFFQIGQVKELYSSFSCTVQSQIHCGYCDCCVERIRGFDMLGEKDKATYAKDWDVLVENCHSHFALMQEPSKEN